MVSGFAWPLGVAGWSTWPWSSAWFMFSSSDGRVYHLEVSGTLADGRPVAIDMRRWFRFPAAFESPRYNEIARTPENIGALARYVCRRYNADAAPGARLVHVSVVDATWPQRRGARVDAAHVAPGARQLTTYLHDGLCPADDSMR